MQSGTRDFFLNKNYQNYEMLHALSLHLAVVLRDSYLSLSEGPLLAIQSNHVTAGSAH